MSESTTVTSGVAERYATALFTICEEEGQLKHLQKDVDILSEVMQRSNDFRTFVTSPMYRREQQESAIDALAKHLKVLIQTRNLLCLLARKGRIFILPALIKEVRALLDSERGEMGVEIISAGNLSKSQITQLEKTVSKLLKKKAKIKVSIDKSLISGMVVKLGSKMIDTSIKSKLLKLQTIMKEVS